jgi:GDP-L-fucose synthase
MSYWGNKKILLTGGNGFLGTFVTKNLKKQGVIDENLIIPRSKECDLREWKNCVKSVENVDIVIHLAANVGGIGFNMENPGSLFYDNAIMGLQMVEAARQANVEKFVAIGTICSYPKFTPVPFKEEDLWNGYPEETNAPYGLAKKMLLVQTQAYKKEYNFNSINLLPVNLYGPGDNFNPDSSHVIPALIKKTYEAKKFGIDHINVWGTGTSTREFIYVEDAANAIIMATEHYNNTEPVNIGSGFEISIKDLINLIIDIFEYEGEVIWDITKPDGQPKRCLDVSKAQKEFGFVAKTDFEEGLRKTIKWYNDELKI